MTAAEVLRAARAKIEDPARWTRGIYAAKTPLPAELIGREFGDADMDEWYGKHGAGVEDEEAVCFCATGAIWSAGGTGNTDPLMFLSRVTRPKYGSVPAFNDDPSTTHADVLAAFDRAIALAEAS